MGERLCGPTPNWTRSGSLIETFLDPNRSWYALRVYLDRMSSERVELGPLGSKICNLVILPHMQPRGPS